MRKLFFFTAGLISAACLILFLSNENAFSRTFKRPPKLRATVLFPQPKGGVLLAVAFSHNSHFRFGQRKCSLCHNGKVFSDDEELGINKITMDAIYEGKFCGHCHNGKSKTEAGKVIFAPKDGHIANCVLCHNVKMRIKKTKK